MKEGAESEQAMKAEVSVKEPREKEFRQPLEAGINDKVDSPWHPEGIKP